MVNIGKFNWRRVIISSVFTFWVIVLTSLPMNMCLAIGTICPTKKGYPFIYYEVKDYFGKDIYKNYWNLIYDFVIWFILFSILIYFFGKFSQGKSKK